MRLALLLVVVCGSAHAQTLTSRLQDCYRIDAVRARADCIGSVMGTPPSAPPPPPPEVKRSPPPPIWTTSEEVDRMTDEYSCTVMLGQHRSPGSPHVVFRTSMPPFLFLVGDDYPGRTISVRVDDRVAIESKDDEFLRGRELQTLLAQARTGERLLTKYIEWPSGAPVVSEFRLEGFGAMTADCERRVAEQRKASR